MNYSPPNFRLFTIFALFFLFGIAVSSLSALNYPRSKEIFIGSCILLLLTALFNLLYKNKLLAIISFSFFSLLSGMFYYSYYSFKQEVVLPFGEEIKIEGVVIKRPDVDYKKQQAPVLIENIEGNAKYTEGAIILVKFPHFPSVHYGDKVSFSGKIEKPGMIEEFDYGKYLRRRLIYGVVANPEDSIAHDNNLSLGQKFFSNLYYAPARFEQSLNLILAEPQSSLASGILLGVKRNIPDDFKEALSVTGTTHIVALSGFNVTIIAIILGSILANYFNKKKVFIISLLLIITFVLLTGAAPSVVRAAIFSLLIIFGKTLGRRADQTNLMLLAALVMVLFNPFILMDDVGFQLSFLAFCGLLYISPFMKIILEKTIIRKTSKYFQDTLTETLSAQTAVLPLIIFVFGRVSLISPLTNIAVLWIIPYAMALVFVTGLFGIIYYPLGKIASFFAWPALSYMVSAINITSKIPGASVDLGKNSSFLLFVLYLMLISSGVFFYRKYKIPI